MIENPLTELLSSVDWELLVPIILGIIAAGIMLWVRTRLQRWAAYMDFKSSEYVSLGTWIRMGTAVGHVDGQIIRVTTRRIIVYTEYETYRLIPITDFGKHMIEVIPYRHDRKSILPPPAKDGDDTVPADAKRESETTP